MMDLEEGAAMTDEREIVLNMLLAVERGEAYSHQILRDTLEKYQYLGKQSRSFITRLFEGTLEYQYQLDWIIAYYAVGKKPLKPLIRCVLRLGIYQILYVGQVPSRAAVNEAVRLVKKHGFTPLAGFVNGILRRISREKENLPHPDKESRPQEYLAWRYSMPPWIVDDWTERFGAETAGQMLADTLTARAVTIRTNKRKITPEALAARLTSEGIQAEPGHFFAEAFTLSGLDYLGSLPSFREGLFWVQDESSMLAVAAAGIAPGSRVLDLCAAPGGKSLLAAEYTAGGEVLARDLTPAKAALIEENAARVGCANLAVQCHDALLPDEALFGKMDVVLADLPCSGLGVLARKSDIKYRIQPKDQLELAALQRRILSVAKQYVKPGGCLLYSTCTISQAENEENVAWMQEAWEDFHMEALFPEATLSGVQKSAPDKALAARLAEEGSKGFLQILPGVTPCDGFFLAKFRRSI